MYCACVSVGLGVYLYVGRGCKCVTVWGNYGCVRVFVFVLRGGAGVGLRMFEVGLRLCGAV